MTLSHPGQPRRTNGQFAEKHGTESEVSLMAENGNLPSYEEVDALYARAAAAEKQLVDRDLRNILDQHRPGTRSVLVTEWSGSGEIDIVAFENADGSINTDYNDRRVISDFFSDNIVRFSRIIDSRAMPRVGLEETSDFQARVIGGRRLVGGHFYRFGEAT